MRHPERAKASTRKATKAWKAKNPEAIVQQRVRHRSKHSEQLKAYALKYHYGLALEQHKAMYLAQNGCCAVCGEPVSYDKVHTDHDHNTGRVRGLLCGGCNRAIAIFDNHELLEKAIQYLE